jgi:hypothetical protein
MIFRQQILVGYVIFRIEFGSQIVRTVNRVLLLVPIDCHIFDVQMIVQLIEVHAKCHRKIAHSQEQFRVMFAGQFEGISN